MPEYDVEEEAEANHTHQHREGEGRVARHALAECDAEGLDSSDLSEVLHDLDRDEKAVQGRHEQDSPEHLHEAFELHENVPIVLQWALWVHCLCHAVLLDIRIRHLVLGIGVDPEFVLVPELVHDEQEHAHDAVCGDSQRDEVGPMPRISEPRLQEEADAPVHELFVVSSILHVQDVSDHEVGNEQEVYPKEHHASDPVGFQETTSLADVERDGLGERGLPHLPGAQQAEAHHVLGKHVDVAVVGDPIKDHRCGVLREPSVLAQIAKFLQAILWSVAEAEDEAAVHVVRAQVRASSGEVVCDTVRDVGRVHCRFDRDVADLGHG
mmetsp:Transcript_895/g.3587  ORF Transcript_895/g.3587 Transcript_895/m.3587 type:complete len:324 (+) Transcript_895:961-1932(+)